MWIKSVSISKETVYKIHSKHGIKFSEVKGLLLTNPYVRKTKFQRFIAIGKTPRFVTVVFEYANGIADIVTAYPSAEWQIKLYKKSKEK